MSDTNADIVDDPTDTGTPSVDDLVKKVGDGPLTEDQLAIKYGWPEAAHVDVTIGVADTVAYQLEEEVSEPADEDLRYNPHHDSLGHFASGGKGHSGLGGVFPADKTVTAGGQEITPAKLADHKNLVESIGAMKGEDWSVEIAKPRNVKEEKSLAKTEKAGKVLVMRQRREKITESQDGDEHYIDSLGHTEALVRPLKSKTAEGWVSETQPQSAMAVKKKFDTKEEALDHARAFVQKKVDRQAERDTEYKAVDNLATHLQREVVTHQQYGSYGAAKQQTTWRVIAPADQN